MTTITEQELDRAAQKAADAILRVWAGSKGALKSEIVRAIKAEFASIQPVAAPEPVAWAAFADNGNIRIWTSAPDEARKLAESAGMNLIPLYTAAPAQAATDAVRELYTCIGKGGTYSLIGKPCAAGSLRGVLISNDFAVYRDIESGMLFVRLADDFDARMERIATAQAATGEAKP